MKSAKSLLFLFLLSLSVQLDARQPADDVNAFVTRIVKDRAPDFKIEFIPADSTRDVFEIETISGKVVLRGNNGVSIGSALNHYLRYYCNSLITWNGVNLNIPGVLPVVDKKIRRVSPHKYRYYLNYCTFNYSMAWWDWNRWQKEIDWMTLNGINMPLAFTGAESVWDKVYRQMGFKSGELDRFFSGPSYFAWFWMGNLDGWDGPLSRNWMDGQEALQKKIVSAERAMGMKTVLPAFTGHVPPSFDKRFPDAKVKRTNWRSGFDDVLVLDPSDPMFETIGKLFIEEQTKMYGTDHLYSADTFNENIPPTTDSTFLSGISKRVFGSMAIADPKAVWVMQGWMFHYDSAYWRPTQMQALLNAVPDDQMIILDLYSESFPLWKKTNAYYGKPWIWNMLHNFGGNISLWGRIDNPAKDPAAVLRDHQSGRITGIGLAPEAIEQNPVLYHLMLENVWRSEPIQLDTWLRNYAHQRYGKVNEQVNKGWQLLANSVYKGGLTEGGPESIITARPTLERSVKWANTNLSYDPMQLVQAWELFYQAAPALQWSDGFRYDLIDITRQVLANYAGELQQRFAAAYQNNQQDSFHLYSKKFLGLIDDLDALLATRTDFLLGKWINDARRKGITESEKDIYEKNARNLITLWGGKDSPLHDYSCRQWAGLLKGFYKPRWQQFLKQLDSSPGKKPDWKALDNKSREWEWTWVDGHERYSEHPSGDEIETVTRLYKKYRNAFPLSTVAK